MSSAESSTCMTKSCWKLLRRFGIEIEERRRDFFKPRNSIACTQSSVMLGAEKRHTISGDPFVEKSCSLDLRMVAAAPPRPRYNRNRPKLCASFGRYEKKRLSPLPTTSIAYYRALSSPPLRRAIIESIPLSPSCPAYGRP